jgi:hypothetical protein
VEAQKAADEEAEAEAAAAAAEAVAKLSGTHENIVAANMPARRRRRSMTMEFHTDKDEDIMHALQDVYDPKRQAVGHELYTLQNLLRRESVQWDYRVRKVLDVIWKAIDIDGSGGISKDEYEAMHEQMYSAVHELEKVKGTKAKAFGENKPGKAKKNETPEEKVARQRKVREGADWREAEEAEMKKRQLDSFDDDWDADCQGHKHLNYQRFTQCWFVMADRFTQTVDAREYAEFLEKVQRMMAEYRARHPEKYHPDFHNTKNKKLHDGEDHDKRPSKDRTKFIVKKFKSAVKAVIQRVSDWGLHNSNIRWGDRVLLKKKARGGVDADCGDDEAVDGYVCGIIKIENPAYKHGTDMPEGTRRYFFEYNIRCSDGQEAKSVKPEFLKVMGINTTSPSPGDRNRRLGGNNSQGLRGGQDPSPLGEGGRRVSTTKEERIKNIAARREAERRASGDWADGLRGAGSGFGSGPTSKPKPSVGANGRRASREAFGENDTNKDDPPGARRKSGLQDAAAAAVSAAMMRRASREDLSWQARRASGGQAPAPGVDRLSQPRAAKKKVVSRAQVYVLDSGDAASAVNTPATAAPIVIAKLGHSPGTPGKAARALGQAAIGSPGGSSRAVGGGGGRGGVVDGGSGGGGLGVGVIGGPCKGGVAEFRPRAGTSGGGMGAGVIGIPGAVGGAPRRGTNGVLAPAIPIAGSAVSRRVSGVSPPAIGLIGNGRKNSGLTSPVMSPIVVGRPRRKSTGGAMNNALVAANSKSAALEIGGIRAAIPSEGSEIGGRRRQSYDPKVRPRNGMKPSPIPRSGFAGLLALDDNNKGQGRAGSLPPLTANRIS